MSKRKEDPYERLFPNRRKQARERKKQEKRAKALSGNDGGDVIGVVILFSVMEGLPLLLLGLGWWWRPELWFFWCGAFVIPHVVAVVNWIVTRDGDDSAATYAMAHTFCIPACFVLCFLWNDMAEHDAYYKKKEDLLASLWECESSTPLDEDNFSFRSKVFLVSPDRIGGLRDSSNEYDAKYNPSNEYDAEYTDLFAIPRRPITLLLTDFREIGNTSKYRTNVYDWLDQKPLGYKDFEISGDKVRTLFAIGSEVDDSGGWYDTPGGKARSGASMARATRLAEEAARNYSPQEARAELLRGAIREWVEPESEDSE